MGGTTALERWPPHALRSQDKNIYGHVHVGASVPGDAVTPLVPPGRPTAAPGGSAVTFTTRKKLW